MHLYGMDLYVPCIDYILTNPVTEFSSTSGKSYFVSIRTLYAASAVYLSYVYPA